LQNDSLSSQERVRVRSNRKADPTFVLPYPAENAKGRRFKEGKWHYQKKHI